MSFGGVSSGRDFDASIILNENATEYQSFFLFTL